uniref:Uncharacterized protein n=1 Tax=Peronospora matthiolae TaxID=2874970 RepID=A0AAV1T5I0_9STRA
MLANSAVDDDSEDGVVNTLAKKVKEKLNFLELFVKKESDFN